ncbi:hypothetical protein R50345_11175 [Paenibacillus sp. FSL R5-0345]|nr:hypothetical protein R50345_11175 [Paenibacillus sp. FSL R5-0345]
MPQTLWHTAADYAKQHLEEYLSHPEVERIVVIKLGISKHHEKKCTNQSRFVHFFHEKAV